MLPLPPLTYETVTVDHGTQRNVARVAPLRDLLESLEAHAGRASLAQLLARRETQVIRPLHSPYPLVLHAGQAYTWGSQGWQPLRLSPTRQKVVSTYPLTPSHLTLSLLRETLLAVDYAQPLPLRVQQVLPQYACLCPLPLLGVPERIAAQVMASVTPHDRLSSRALRPPDQHAGG